MFVKVKGTDNREFTVPKTFYETVLKDNGFTLAEVKPKKEVENAKFDARIEKQDNRESQKTVGK